MRLARHLTPTPVRSGLHEAPPHGVLERRRHEARDRAAPLGRAVPPPRRLAHVDEQRDRPRREALLPERLLAQTCCQLREDGGKVSELCECEKRELNTSAERNTMIFLARTLSEYLWRVNTQSAVFAKR